MSIKKSVALVMAAALAFTSFNLDVLDVRAEETGFIETETDFDEVIPEEEASGADDVFFEGDMIDADVLPADDHLSYMDGPAYENENAWVTDDVPADEEDESEDALYAQSYEILFHGNGGRFYIGTSTYTFQRDPQGLMWERIPVYRPGYLFTGWYEDNACTKLVSKGSRGDARYEFDEDNLPGFGTDLYAGWTDDIYTVTYVFGYDETEDPADINDTGYWYGSLPGQGSGDMQHFRTVSYAYFRDEEIPGNDIPYDFTIRNDDLHCSFAGWYSDEARENPTAIDTTPDEDATYYAGYVSDKIVLTLHTNLDEDHADMGWFNTDIDYDGFREKSGRFDTIQYRIKKEGEQYLPSVYVGKADPSYTITGWYKTSEMNEEDYVGDYGSLCESRITQDMHLYAKWGTAGDYKKITFNSGDGAYFCDDGTGYEKVESVCIGVTANTEVTESISNPYSNDLHKEFLGWSTDPEATVPDEGMGVTPDYGTIVNFTKTFTEDTIYYAVWDDDAYRVVTLKTNVGKIGVYNDRGKLEWGEYESVELRADGETGILINPGIIVPEHDEDRFAFAGWNIGDTQLDITGLYYHVLNDGDVAIARFEPGRKLTLDANGGYFLIGGEKVTTYSDKHKYEYGITMPDPYPSSGDLIFAGWYLDKDCTRESNYSGLTYYSGEESITLYAKWAHARTVTFDAGEGSFGSGQTEFKCTVAEGATFGAYVDLPSDPISASDDKAFYSWFKDPDFDDPITKEEILNTVISEDITFYAQYQDAYKITFHIEDHGRFAFDKDAEKDNTYVAKAVQQDTVGWRCPAVRPDDGYVFTGWFRNEGGERVEVENLYGLYVDDDIDLYAGYSTGFYTITFIANDGGVTGAKLDGSSEPVVVRIPKGEPLRYSGEGSALSEYCGTPALDISGVNTGLYYPFQSYSGMGLMTGWYTKDDEGNADDGVYYFGRYNSKYVDGDGKATYFKMYGFVPTEDMTFYVKWAEPVTLSFDANGGKFRSNYQDDQYSTLVSDTLRTTTIAKGVFFNDVYRPSIYSYSMEFPEGMNNGLFEALDSAGKTFVQYNAPLTEPKTIYARWYASTSAKPTTLHAGEGYFYQPSAKTQTVALSESGYATTVPNIDDPQKAFLGWYYDEALTKPYPAKYQWINESGSPSFRMPEYVAHLYAKYAPTYTVTLDANGGYFDEDENRSINPVEKTRRTTLLTVKPEVVGGPIRISNYNKRVRRDGNRLFAGWTYGNGKNAVTQAMTQNYELFYPEENVTLYAEWGQYEKPDSIELDNSKSISLKKGGKADLKSLLTVSPVTLASDVHWYVSRYSYADVRLNPTFLPPVMLGSDGIVTAQAAGEAWIQAELNGEISNEVRVVVSSDTVKPTITLGVTSINLVKGDTYEVTATVTPDLYADDVVWSSSASAIASVSGTGATAVITANNKAGKAVITAKIGDVSKSITVNVSVPLLLDTHEMILTSKDNVKRTITAGIYSDDLKDLDVVWSINDSGVAAITKTGDHDRQCEVVPATGLTATETTVITASITTDERTYSDTCTVTVNPLPQAPEPYADPGSSQVDKGTRIALRSDLDGAKIYYTTDDTEPSIAAYLEAVENGTTENCSTGLYTDTIEITANTTIKALCDKEGYETSSVQEFVYGIRNDNWGDVPEGTRSLFEGSSALPSGMWIALDNGGEISAYTSEDEVLNITPEYTGAAITFTDDIEVYNFNRKLVRNRDYTVSYARNTATADADKTAKGKSAAPTVTIKGAGNYSGSTSFRFAIIGADINLAQITSLKEVTIKSGTKLNTVKPAVSYMGKPLKAGTDYDLKYYKNSVDDPANEIPADELKTYKAETGTVYKVQIVDHEGGNFIGHGPSHDLAKEETVTVNTIDQADTSVVRTADLKIGNAKGKAVTMSYFENVTPETLAAYYVYDDETEEYAVDITKVFDNSGENKALAFVYAKSPSKPLVYGTDYTIEVDESTDHASAGKHSFVIKGLERELTDEQKEAGEKSYVGYKAGSYTISGVAMKKVKIAGLKTTLQYAGRVFTMDDLFNAKDKVVTAYNKTAADADKWNKVTLYTTSKVKVNGKKKTVYNALTEGEDYDISFENSGVTGKCSLVITGKGLYQGTVKKTITVKAYNVKDDSEKRLTIIAEDGVYSKAGARPAVTVTYKIGDDVVTLEEGRDYKVSYKNNTKVALATAKKKAPTVVITGKGNFTGKNQSVKFSIAKAEIANAAKIAIGDVTYKAKGKKGYMLITPKLTDNGKSISIGKKKDVNTLDKTKILYTYYEDTEMSDGSERYAGEKVLPTDKPLAGAVIKVSVTVTCPATSSYTSDEEGTEIIGLYRIIDPGKDISKFKVQILDASSLTFEEGSPVMPLKADNLKVYKGSNVLTPMDYEIVSVSNNLMPGTATAVIRGRGEYGGTKSFTFKIKTAVFD